MSRMPPPEGHHGLPPVPHTYEPAWRPPYAPHFESHGHPPDRRPPTTTTQATLPPPNYPAMQSRELPQLHLDGPYSRTASLPGPGVPVPEPHPSQHAYRPPVNGAPHEASPHSAPPEYRAPRIGYQPPEPPGPGETTPTSGPLPPPSQFMSPAPVSAPTPGNYPSGGPEYYGSAAYGIRQRKAARAQQACDQCRARKAKCDEGRPECSHCKENGLKCVYKEVPTHKQEKSIQPIMTSLMHFKDEVLQDLKRIHSEQEHNTNLLSQLIGAQGLPAASQTQLAQAAIPVPPRELPVKMESRALPAMDPMTDKNIYGQQQRLDANVVSFDEATLKNDNEGELSIPLEHTTAAHKLLMWPSIKKLLTPHDYDKDYVMGLEGQRGVTSIFDRGEDSFSADGSRLPWDPTKTKRDMNAQTQSGIASWAGSALEDSDADISRLGILRLDGNTVKRYYRSYIKQMHILHPFLDQRELETKVDTFIECYCPADSNSLCREKKRKRSVEDVDGSGRDSSTRPPVGLNMDCAIVLLTIAVGAICETKSPLPGPVMDKEPDFRQQFIPGPKHPIQTPANGTNGTNTLNGFLSPANSDSALPSNTSFYAPFEGASHSFPSSAIESRPDKTPLRRPTIYDGQPKNHQVIPGLALYGYAIQILAFLHSGIYLEHVQANLLAGLYAGQLAHPFSSHSHIHKAAWACQVLVASKEYKELEGGPKQDLFNFVYWTCLQLESDLLAELDIPASGISRSETTIPTPKGKWTIIPLPNDMNDPHVLMMMFYSAQIHLRKVLNRVHTDLYKVEKEGQARWSSSVQEALSQNLDLWRFSLPKIMAWDDEHPPAKEINAARMRAKYYGARYIIHRPLLYHALHYGGSGARVDAAGQPSVDSPTGSAGNPQMQQMSPSIANTSHRSQNMTRMLSDIGTVSSNPAAAFPNGWTPPTVNLRELPSKLRRACKVCVDSAILSTKAFDGIEDPFEALSNPFKAEPYKSMQDPLEGHRMEDPFAMDPNFASKDEKNRLVVTNIFGTAHAQFGNLLVLSATYMSSLSELVDRDELKALLKRTIRFLLRSEQISPTLRADARILTEIYKKIFHHSPTLDKPTTP